MKCIKIARIIAIIMFFNAVVLMLTSCRSSEGNTVSENNMISGSTLAMGSSALLPLAQEASRQFMIKYPDTDVQVQGGGSGNGLTAVFQGVADIGNSDIFAEEKKGIDSNMLEDHKVCVVGFAVVVNPKVNVENITKKQLIDIFTGKVVNWKEVGGNDVSVVLINRPASSGTRSTFKKYALDSIDEAQGKALTEDNSGTVLKTVADTEGAISYISLSYLKGNTVKALKLDGIAPTAENIAIGKYPIWSYEHMYTKGPAKGVTKTFIEFMIGDDIKQLVQKLDYIPINDMQVKR